MPEVTSSRIETSQAKCGECGMLHPPVAPGECPLAKEQAMKEEVESTGNKQLVLLVQAIQTKLMEKLRGKPDEYSNAVATELFKYIERL